MRFGVASSAGLGKRIHPVDALAFLAYLGFGALLFASFDASAVQSGDAWIVYLPAAIAISRLDLAMLREALTFGVGRPIFLSSLIAGVHALLPSLSYPQCAQIAISLSVSAVLIASHLLLRRRLEPHGALATCVTLAGSPAFLPCTAYVVPDVLFTACALALVWSMLLRSTSRAISSQALCAITRANGQYLSLGVFLFVLGARRTMTRARLATAVLAIGAITAVSFAYSSWTSSGVPIGDQDAEIFHPDLFIEGATGWSLMQKLRFSSVRQYGAFARRFLWSAPIDFVKAAFGDGPFISPIAGVLAMIGVIGVVMAALSAWREPNKRIFVLSGGALFASTYVPVAALHWETRYWLPLEVGALLFGAVTLHRWSRWARTIAAGALVACVGSVVLALGFRTLVRSYERRTTLSADQHREFSPAESEARRVIDLMLSRSNRRPLRIAGCEAIAAQYMNYVRYLEHARELECVGLSMQKPTAWSDVDYAILRKGGAPSEEESLDLGYILGHAEAIHDFTGEFDPYHLALFENRVLGFGEPQRVAEFFATRTSTIVRVFEAKEHDADWSSDASGTWTLSPKTRVRDWRSVRSQSIALGKDDVMVTRFEVGPASRLHDHFAYGYDVDGSIMREGQTQLRGAIPERPSFSSAYQCPSDRCQVSFRFFASAKERPGKLRVRVLEMRIWRAHP
jgi:hypothetical protein